MSLSDHLLAGVKSRRDLLGIKAAALARLLAIEPASFSRIERGERRCYLDKAATLAAALGCTIEELATEPSADEKIAAYAKHEHGKMPGKEYVVETVVNQTRPEIADQLNTFNRSEIVSPAPIADQALLDEWGGNGDE